MAIPTSGPFSLNTLQTEFGGSNPISISEYYRNGTYIFNNSSASLVPTSGTIKYSDFRGATALVVYRIRTSSPNSIKRNTDIKALFDSLNTVYWTGNYPKELIIDSGVEIGATSRSNAALTVSSSMGGTLLITNNGTISGAGGQATDDPNFVSKNGGTAIFSNQSVSIVNNGTIRGGGGAGKDGPNGGTGGYGGYGWYIARYDIYQRRRCRFCPNCDFRDEARLWCFNQQGRCGFFQYRDIGCQIRYWATSNGCAGNAGAAGGIGGRGQGFDGARQAGSAGSNRTGRAPCSPGGDGGYGGAGGDGASGGTYGNSGNTATTTAENGGTGVAGDNGGDQRSGFLSGGAGYAGASPTLNGSATEGLGGYYVERANTSLSISLTNNGTLLGRQNF